MRAIGGRLAKGVALGALALALPAPLLAQTFSLPPGSASPTPRPAGPVDTDAPVVVPRPTPAPRPTATAPAPTPTPTPVATATGPSPRPAGAAERPAPTRARPDAAQPGVAAPSTAQPGAIPSASPGFAPAPLPSYAPAGAAATPAQPGFFAANWPWLLGLLAALGAGAGAMLWLRRREERDPVVDFEPPVVAAPAPPAEPERDALVEPVPAAPAAVLADDGPLALVLEATRLSATLLNTSLTYKLSLTNLSDAPLGPLTVGADMIAAHATLPVERQLGLDGKLLERRHALAALAPGESVTVTGEIRLPLALIQPIRAGAAALFIPLARFQVEGPGLALARTFVVGEAPEVADAGLRPFRLDLGPRVYSRVGQREIVAAAA